MIEDVITQNQITKFFVPPTTEREVQRWREQRPYDMEALLEVGIANLAIEKFGFQVVPEEIDTLRRDLHRLVPGGLENFGLDLFDEAESADMCPLTDLSDFDQDLLFDCRYPAVQFVPFLKEVSKGEYKTIIRAITGVLKHYQGTWYFDRDVHPFSPVSPWCAVQASFVSR